MWRFCRSLSGTENTASSQPSSIRAAGRLKIRWSPSLTISRARAERP